MHAWSYVCKSFSKDMLTRRPLFSLRFYHLFESFFAANFPGFEDWGLKGAAECFGTLVRFSFRHINKHHLR